MFETPENVIHEISLQEVIRKFGPVYKEERLSLAATRNTNWYANDYSCASLYWQTPRKARIKGTVTLPEYRGFGYGSTMLQHLITVVERKAQELGQPIQLESYARNPKWYLNNGFSVHRVTPWSVTVVRRVIGNGSN